MNIKTFINKYKFYNFSSIVMYKDFTNLYLKKIYIFIYTVCSILFLIFVRINSNICDSHI